MLNEASIRAVEAARWRDSFVRPLYESYCFANLPSMVSHLFANEYQMLMPSDVLGDLPRRYRTVVLLLVDGFGWRHFVQMAERVSLFRRVLREGVVSKLTALFPSTTAAHMTCLHTGQTPSQSGVYEWFQYHPELDRIIAPLLFSFAGDKGRNTLSEAGLVPADVFPNETIYQHLKRAGVQATLFHPSWLSSSLPARALAESARSLHYDTLAEGLVNLRRAVEEECQPSYFVLYYGGVDGLGHEYGPAAEQALAELDHFCVAVERYLLEPLRSHDLLLIVTADHGMAEVNPQRTIYLNQTLASFNSYVSVNRYGEPLVPAGSPRDLFLHIKPELLDEAQSVLTEHLRGKAIVVKTAELIAAGFFGTSPSARFLARVGNLVVLPFIGESVYYRADGKFEMRYLGHHGGLTREEMEIPLLMCAL